VVIHKRAWGMVAESAQISISLRVTLSPPACMTVLCSKSIRILAIPSQRRVSKLNRPVFTRVFTIGFVQRRVRRPSLCRTECMYLYPSVLRKVKCDGGVRVRADVAECGPLTLTSDVDD